jgi:F-type H+-transporting ATPase subunit alpha
LNLGKQIYAVLQQPPEELHSLVEQQLMLETVILGGGTTAIDIEGLKESAKKMAKDVKKEEDFDKIEAELLKKHAIKPKEVPVEKPAEDSESETQTSEEQNAKS